MGVTCSSLIFTGTHPPPRRRLFSGSALQPPPRGPRPEQRGCRRCGDCGSCRNMEARAARRAYIGPRVPAPCSRPRMYRRGGRAAFTPQ